MNYCAEIYREKKATEKAIEEERQALAQATFDTGIVYLRRAARKNYGSCAIYTPFEVKDKVIDLFEKEGFIVRFNWSDGRPCDPHRIIVTFDE